MHNWVASIGEPFCNRYTISRVAVSDVTRSVRRFDMADVSQGCRCHRCGQTMAAGFATALGLLGGNPPPGDAKLVFVVCGEPTSPNPIHAFKQGLQEERSNKAYLLRRYRCPACEIVELIATNLIPYMP
jgi:hypothetical protein